MRFGVESEQIAATAATTRADAQRIACQYGPLAATGTTTPAWAVGRAARAGQALFDTLAAAARQVAGGLDELGDRASAAAGDYDGVEQRLLRGG